MAFDPTKPADGAFATAAALRDQFNGLKALIDAIPAGPEGPQGPPGPVEVSQQQLNSAIAGTAQNPASVQTLSVGTTDPTLTAIIDKLNELIAALRR